MLSVVTPEQTTSELGLDLDAIVREELGFRVAKAMHYQARWARSYQELAAIEAEETAGQ